MSGSRRMPRLAIGILSAMLAGLISAPASAASREITLPVRPDTTFLRQAIVSQMFTEEGTRARVWDDGSGCNFLVLSDPRVRTGDGVVRVLSHAEARVGQRLGSRCLVVTDWSGTIETTQNVELAPGGTALRFEVIDSRIQEEEERKGVSMGILWNWIKDYVHPRLGAVRIDLQPALNDLRAVLDLALPGEGGDTSLDSITMQSVSVAEDGLLVELGMTVPEAAEPEEEPAAALTPAELARFESAWKGWDSFVTFIVKHFAATTAAPEVRRELLQVLIEARYDVLRILATDTGRARADPVRALFMNTWTRLSPVLRQLSSQMPGERALNLLSFITAADALYTLDAVGPELNLEISLDGLRRMARIVAPAGDQDPLQYDEGVDPELRELFDFGPPLPVREDRRPEQQGWWRGLLPAARASISVDDDLVERLNGWVPPLSEIDAYLESVHRLLNETGRGLVSESGLDPALHEMFRLLVLATAWQETCWRQFTRVDDQVVPIRSPAGAVGMMQVVPSVWRGFYETGALTSDIAYNAAAGGEILMHYLQKYAIPRGEDRQPGGRENLAWATYAAYNGGPGHLQRYRRDDTQESLKNIDLAFRDKYQQLREGNELAVRACYSG